MIVSKRKYKAAIDALKETREELEKLRGGVIPKPPGGETEVVFIDKQGRKHYRYVDPTTMPSKRGIHSQLLNRMVNLNLTPDLNEAFAKEIEAMLDAGKVGRGLELLYKMVDRAKLPTETEILLKIAAIHYLREDEDPMDFDEGFAQAKIQDWKKDKETIDFFLQMQYREIWDCGKLSNEQILDSLKKAQEELDLMKPKQKK